mgnify:FL=1
MRVHPDGVSLELPREPTFPSSLYNAPAEPKLSGRLLLDCMGHRSPIGLQQRGGQVPDGVCVQVGS